MTVSAEPIPPGAAAAGTLVTATDLVKHYPLKSGVFQREIGIIQAVNGVSFTIERGKTLGLVGESGSGKSTTARLVNRLIEPTSGTLSFDGFDVFAAPPREVRRLRRRVQMVFQDPNGTLSPRMTILQSISEPLEVHGLASSQRDKVRRVGEVLELVGLAPSDMHKFPHQFSGGQAQRVGIARALVTNPDLIICDEPVSALDASVQAQVLNLLDRLQRELGLTYLFIAHDLNVVRVMSDEVCVMYLGEIVERGRAEVVFKNPSHPYTRALVSAVPDYDPDVAKTRERASVRGEIPSPSNPPSGCRFHTRCPFAWDLCREQAPPMWTVDADHGAACHLHDARRKDALPW
jgi:oligopeptide/dipeptide ABC transporter ATP-binding protein